MELENNWYLFRNSIFQNIHLSDCSNGIHGYCENVKTLKDCIEICQNGPECSHGYFVKGNNRNYCVPLQNHPEMYPYHRLRNKDIYKEFDNVESTVFLNKHEFPFPPFKPNVIFYRDRMTLVHRNLGMSVGSDDNNDSFEKRVIFDKDYPVSVQFVQKEVMRTGVDEFLPVKNGDKVVINIPETAFVLHRQNDQIIWRFGIGNVNEDADTFVINVRNKKFGENITYDDIFYLTSFMDLITVHGKNMVISQDKGISDDSNAYFIPIPMVPVKYCNNGRCEPIELKNTQMHGEQAFYKDKKVYRFFCDETCGKQTENEENNSKWRIYGVFIFLFLIFFILIFFGIFVKFGYLVRKR